MENNTNQLNSMLCKRNCGFFGNAACDGYCSKCYKDHVKRQNSGSAAGRVTPTSISHTEASNGSALAAANNNNTSIQTEAAQLTQQQSTQVSSSSLTSSSTTTATIPIPIPHHHKQQTQTASNNSETVFMVCESAPAYTSIESSTPVQPQQANAEAVAAETAVGGMLQNETIKSVDSSSDLSTSLNTSEKKKRTRCCVDTCKRKVGLTGFDCRCGGLYCWEHRYSDKHDCKFDYKELGQDQIRKNNPIVVGEKIQKI